MVVSLAKLGIQNWKFVQWDIVQKCASFDDVGSRLD
jgi:hypothetical protein